MDKNYNSNHIKDLFSTNDTVQETFNPKLNRLILNEAVLAALEDNEVKFDNMLSKSAHLMDRCDIHRDHKAMAINDNIKAIYVYSENNYRTFIHLAADLLPENYAIKIVNKALKEDLSSYLKDDNTQSNIQLVESCFNKNKPEILNLVVKSQLLKKRELLDIIFISSTGIPQVSNRLAVSQPQLLVDTFKENIFNTDNIKSEFLCSRVKEWFANCRDVLHQKEMRDSVVPFLLRLHTKHYLGQEFIKDVLMDLMAMEIIKLDTKFDKHNKYALDVGSESIEEKLEMQPEDFKTISIKRANYLVSHLNENIKPKASHPQVKI